MTLRAADDPALQAVNDALKFWRQGDCVLGEQWFVSAFDPDLPLTDAALRAKDAGGTLVENEVRGLVVVTQSCDIVRDCKAKPFAEVSPLVEVEAGMLNEVKRLRRPNYALVPGLEHLSLVADLDMTMTVEKAVVAKWARTEGCRTDEERKLFSWCLARKRSRFAFPDDFNEWVEPLEDRIEDKHGKKSAEGRALAQVDEIRVHADPSWDADAVELTFYFVIPKDAPAIFEGRRWNEWMNDWLKRVPASGRFTRVLGLVGTLDDFTVRDYTDSVLLDLDYLSRR